MPYIITTKRSRSRSGCPASQEAVLERGEDCPLCERSAVAHASEEPVVGASVAATLEEAREAAHVIVAESATAASLAVTTTAGWAPHDDDAIALPESGGTVGPLPDGTVIEVEPSTYDDLADAAEYVGSMDDHAAILASYEAQGTRS